MPIQRRIGIGERLFGGAQSAMPFLLQYLQQMQQQAAPLDLGGIAPPQPVGQAGIGDYDTSATRNILSQMGFQPQGVDPQAMTQAIASQPAPTNIMDQLKLRQKEIDVETAQITLDKLKTPKVEPTEEEIIQGEYREYVKKVNAENRKNLQYKEGVQVPVKPYRFWREERYNIPEWQTKSPDQMFNRTPMQADQPLTPQEKAELERLRARK